MEIKIYPPLAIHELGQRDNQEDAIYPQMGRASADDRLFVVCDGMGGHAHGEVASQTFSRSLADYLRSQANPSEEFTDAMLMNAIEYAYEQLDRKDDGASKKMGTTLTLLYLHRGGATAAHIGDSRIYHIRPTADHRPSSASAADTGLAAPSLLYMSRDHSLVFDLYQSGEISYEEMRTSPKKNVILRAVQPGKDNRVKPDIIHITDIEPGDWFYLCSDGMLEEMDNGELAELLSSAGSDEKKRQQLIAMTLDNKDNHSAYLVRVKSVTREASDTGKPNEEKTSRCNALNTQPAESLSKASVNVAPVSITPQPVTAPSRTNVKPGNRRPWQKYLQPLVLGAAVVTILGLFLLVFFDGKNDKKQQVKPTPKVQSETPVTKPILLEETKRDSQPVKVDAPQVQSAPKPLSDNPRKEHPASHSTGPSAPTSSQPAKIDHSKLRKADDKADPHQSSATQGSNPQSPRQHEEQYTPDGKSQPAEFQSKIENL